MTIKTKIKLKSFNSYKLSAILNSLVQYATVIELEPSVINLKKKVKRLTVLKSPHVHKKSRDQYELVTFTKILKYQACLIKQNCNKKDFYLKVDRHQPHNSTPEITCSASFTH